MAAPQFVDGVVHSPFVICVRAVGHLTDIELLVRLGLYEYRPNDDPSVPGIWITEVGEWLQVLDNLRYDLWHRPDVRERIDSLGWKFDVFAGSVGDVDASYDFELHWGRALARRLVVRCPSDAKARVVETDIGEPLPVESELADGTDGLEIVRRVASSLDIELAGPDASFRRYAPGRLQVIGAKP